jgi:hypothetical protein
MVQSLREEFITFKELAHSIVTSNQAMMNSMMEMVKQQASHSPHEPLQPPLSAVQSPTMPSTTPSSPSHIPMTASPIPTASTAPAVPVVPNNAKENKQEYNTAGTMPTLPDPDELINESPAPLRTQALIQQAQASARSLFDFPLDSEGTQAPTNLFNPQINPMNLQQQHSNTLVHQQLAPVPSLYEANQLQQYQESHTLNEDESASVHDSLDITSLLHTKQIHATAQYKRPNRQLQPGAGTLDVSQLRTLAPALPLELVDSISSPFRKRGDRLSIQEKAALEQHVNITNIDLSLLPPLNKDVTKAALHIQDMSKAHALLVRIGLYSREYNAGRLMLSAADTIEATNICAQASIDAVQIIQDSKKPGASALTVFCPICGATPSPETWGRFKIDIINSYTEDVKIGPSSRQIVFVHRECFPPTMPHLTWYMLLTSPQPQPTQHPTDILLAAANSIAADPTSPDNTVQLASKRSKDRSHLKRTASI